MEERPRLWRRRCRGWGRPRGRRRCHVTARRSSRARRPRRAGWRARPGSRPAGGSGARTRPSPSASQALFAIRRSLHRFDRSAFPAHRNHIAPVACPVVAGGTGRVFSGIQPTGRHASRQLPGGGPALGRPSQPVDVCSGGRPGPRGRPPRHDRWPTTLRELTARTRSDSSMLLLAVGLDPQRCTLFVAEPPPPSTPS